MKKALFVCTDCTDIMACNGIFSKGITVCDYCKVKDRCDIRNNTHKYNYFHTVTDGQCDKCHA